MKSTPKMGRIWVRCRAFFVKSIHFCGSFFGAGFVGDRHTAPVHSTAQRISFFFFFFFWLRRWITHSEGSGAYLRALTRWRYGTAQRRALEWSIYTHTFIRYTLRGALLSVRYTLGGLTLYSIGRFALGIVHNSIRRGCVGNK
jgi:hypothetical protein